MNVNEPTSEDQTKPSAYEIAKPYLTNPKIPRPMKIDFPQESFIAALKEGNVVTKRTLTEVTKIVESSWATPGAKIRADVKQTWTATVGTPYARKLEEMNELAGFFSERKKSMYKVQAGRPEWYMSTAEKLIDAETWIQNERRDIIHVINRVDALPDGQLDAEEVKVGNTM